MQTGELFNQIIVYDSISTMGYISAEMTELTFSLSPLYYFY
jgi:hypothetical protein